MRIILGPIVGGITPCSAKVWIFSSPVKGDQRPECHVYKDEACTEEISKFKFDTLSDSVHRCGGIKGVAELAIISFPEGLEKIYYKIKPGVKNNDRVYSIRTFPTSTKEIDTLSFGLISCHHPSFHPVKDEKNVASMWKNLGEKMKKHDSRFLIQAGDQVYCDHKRFNACEMSLKEIPNERRLWYYRQAYLQSWYFPEVQEVMRSFPQYMIWDDHEIANGWGSEKKHSRDGKYQEIFDIACQVYNEFQHSHNPDSFSKGEYHFAFNYGPVAFMFMDLRGHRDITLFNPKRPEDSSPLVGEDQWDDFTSWINSKVVKESKILFVITSVPVCHLSRKFGSLGKLKNDIADQWSASHNKFERRRLLKMLYNWSGDTNKPVFILGGDVHVGTIANITEKNKTIYQITSSPITNTPAVLLDLVMAKISNKFHFHLEENKKRPVDGKILKRFRRRNFAILNIKFVNNDPRVELYMYSQNKSEPFTITFK